MLMACALVLSVAAGARRAYSHTRFAETSETSEAGEPHTEVVVHQKDHRSRSPALPFKPPMQPARSRTSVLIAQGTPVLTSRSRTNILVPSDRQ
jgi:hypothetical protein